MCMFIPCMYEPHSHYLAAFCFDSILSSLGRAGWEGMRGKRKRASLLTNTCHWSPVGVRSLQSGCWEPFSGFSFPFLKAFKRNTLTAYFCPFLSCHFSSTRNKLTADSCTSDSWICSTAQSCRAHAWVCESRVCGLSDRRRRSLHAVGER